MGYKLKVFEVTDLRTGQVDLVRAKSILTLEKRLGKRVNDVSIRLVKEGK
ncbi:hypothetical protein ACFLTP_01820 [Chloroflexota bacterium]